VTFESGSRLERIEEAAFQWTGLKWILIPSSVVVLGDSSFRFCKSLESVAFESGSRLERIEECAFYDNGLKSILIPSSVVVLGKQSFRFCKSLESVAFESGSRLERIEEYAFYDNGLKSTEIPPNVAFIGSYAFYTQNLRSVWVSPANQHLRIRESFLEDICGSTVYRYFGCCRSIVIPSSVVVLGEGSFSGHKSLESVTFESGSRLERIEERAFCGSGLRSILIPSSVVFLGLQSLSECKSLESVIFESGSRLERIEERAFSGSALESIEIPPNVAFIGVSAFDMQTLRSILVSPANQHFRMRESFLEDISGSTIYRYFGCCRSIVIPSSVVVLGEWSFSGRNSLESVTFESGSRLERIERFAFYGSGLRSILIPSSVVVLGERSFSWCKSLESVIFESGSRLERIYQWDFEDSRVNFWSICQGLMRSKEA
jgi:hypothetical protein